MSRKKGKRQKGYDTRDVYPYERRGTSAYWEWCHRHCGETEGGLAVESTRANPDYLAETYRAPENEYFIAAKEALNDGALDRLTVRQRRAFKLVVIEGLTYSKAARRMGVSWQTVQKHVRGAGRIIRKICEDKA